MKSSFWNIIDNNIEGLNISQGIEVPILQRDYAQGRTNPKTSVIRIQFLNKIKDTLIKSKIEGNHSILDLDFVYGFVNNNRFIPLDGQQRLTTLFLLHWYFIVRANETDKYSKQLNNFTYQVRPTTEDFLKRIVNNFKVSDWEKIVNEKIKLSDLVENENWFLEKWKSDSSVIAMLNMINDIHSVFNDLNIHISDLINTDDSCITFNFLNIENLGLSDDLYIKMNARGKQLTSFENLKAELCRYIEESDFKDKYSYLFNIGTSTVEFNLENYFITKIDTIWTDYFWNLRNKEDNTFDDQLLNILFHIGLNFLAINSSESFSNERYNFERNLQVPSFYQFRQSGLLHESVIIDYIELLDLLVSKDVSFISYLDDNKYIDKKSLLSNFVVSYNTRPEYIERIKLFGILKFYQKIKNHENFLQEMLNFDRLLSNLTSSPYFYNDSNQFAKSLIGINEILSIYKGDINETFLNYEGSGFDKYQTLEEKIKLLIIKENIDCFDTLRNIETDPYLRGQIGFLLKLSGIVDLYNEDNASFNLPISLQHIKKLEEYYLKYKLYFESNGVKQYNNELFRVALLTLEDYLIKHKNWCFVVNGIERDSSWKKVFREMFIGNQEYSNVSNGLKRLFNLTDLDITDVDNLNSIIANNKVDIEEWRYDFIKHPEMIHFNDSYYIYMDDSESEIQLLNKTKLSNKAIEMHTYIISKTLSEHNIKTEIEYLDNYRTSAITSINGKKSSKLILVYEERYYLLLKQRGKEDIYFEDRTEAIDYIRSNYNN